MINELDRSVFVLACVFTVLICDVSAIAESVDCHVS